MDLPLTLDWVSRIVPSGWMASHEIVVAACRIAVWSARPTAELIPRARGGTSARRGGIKRGDRVATLMWNHAEHSRRISGSTLRGVLHTLNLRLHSDEIRVHRHRCQRPDRDRRRRAAAAVRQSRRSGAKFERVIVVGNAGAHEGTRAPRQARRARAAQAPENRQLGVCYTGARRTTQGVVYTHRSAMLHRSSCRTRTRWTSRSAMSCCRCADVHANAWGHAIRVRDVGCKIEFPGSPRSAEPPRPDGAPRRLTCAAGVPRSGSASEMSSSEPDQVQARAEHPHDHRRLRGTGALIRDFDKFGLRLVQAWGMTENVAGRHGVAADAGASSAPDSDTSIRQRAKQGRPTPLVDYACATRTAMSGDNSTSGEVLVRGPWIAASYWASHAGALDRRWLLPHRRRRAHRRHGFISHRLGSRTSSSPAASGSRPWRSRTRSWGHPRSKKRPVVGVPHPNGASATRRVVLKEGATLTADDLRAFLAPKFAKFWLPMRSCSSKRFHARRRASSRRRIAREVPRLEMVKRKDVGSRSDQKAMFDRVPVYCAGCARLEARRAHFDDGPDEMTLRYSTARRPRLPATFFCSASSRINITELVREYQNRPPVGATATTISASPGCRGIRYSTSAAHRPSDRRSGDRTSWVATAWLARHDVADQLRTHGYVVALWTIDSCDYTDREPTRGTALCAGTVTVAT